MRGVWLTRLSEAFLDQETFDLVVSPAIADLQFEARDAGLVTTARGYAGVWVALGGAICRDTHADLRLILADASMLTTLIVLQAAYYAGLLTLISGVVSKRAFESLTAESTLAIGSVILTLSVVFTVLLFWPERRCSSS